ncbi:MAG: ATP-dependent RNA helicase [Alphaproteobacteria bacterium]|nr:ATP-dependent RNA helicase [Alphaproteobacteria bacterium]
MPLWCRDDGPVLVVQPRRVAARSLASHLASTSGGPLGREVGYAVRGAAADDGARVLFVTPGVALRMLAGSRRFRTVILDEFHERTLDLDLLLALVHARDDLALVVLSATLDGDRVAEHLGGTHVRAEGRLYPVDVRYAGPGRDLPDAHGLGVRVRAALAELDGAPGDRLVFVPGRAEIGEVVGALQGSGDEVIELHGGLALRDQDRVFRPGDRRRVIVATNVAETSLTLPGIGVVVDTGLVRRTHYHDGRGWLLLGPIAQDAADQRAGRAGRLGPGIAVRLWGERAPLRERTPPEVHRESLVPLVLAAAAAGHPALALPFVDPPPDHAVQTAREQLQALGALGPDGSITDRGRRLFQLPLDAHLAHLLVVAEAEGGLAEAIDLVAALATPGPLFRPDRPEDDELREGGCDATALLRAVRIGEAGRHRLHGEALADVRREASRLREAFGEPDRRTVDRMDLARLLVAAWPRCAHVVRRRKREVRWSNGGTEVALDRSSAVSEEVDGLLALDFRASGRDRLHRELRVTAALPLSREELASLGVGEERLGEVTVERGALLTVVERVYAGTVLARTTREPTGPMAREALADRLLAGQIWRGFHMAYAERHRLASLDAALEGRETPGEPRATLLARLESVGLEAPGDLALLEREDLLPPEVPDDRRTRLEREFPREVVVGTDRFRVEVLAGARIVELHVLGARLKKPPPASWLPGFRGFSVRLVDRGVRRWLRQG